MATAKHTPPGDDSFRNSLLRSGAGAVGLVALVTVVFAGIGALGPDTDDPTVAGDTQDAGDEAEEPGDDDEALEDDEPEVPDDAGDDDAEVEEPEEAPDPPEASEEPDEAADEDAADDAGEEADAGDDAAEDEGPDDAPAGDRAFAPDSVTIQVLDGYQADGGSAASAVASSLRQEGYRVVAENPSLRYEVTTVLWTPGYEAQAQQVAADLGAAEVRQQPGNLSEQVQVHVVVGADRG